LEAALGRKAERRILAPQAGDVPLTFASADLLQALTGYRPSTPLAEGVARFCGWFQTYRGTAASPPSPSWGGTADA
jgi:UDP-glucuronate 4-epimerase